MNKYLQLCFFSIFFIILHCGINAQVSSGNIVANAEPPIRDFINDFNKSFSNQDSSFTQKWFITKPEYDSILGYAKAKTNNCVTVQETSFDISTNEKAYWDLLNGNKKVTLNEVSLLTYNHNKACEDLLDIVVLKCSLRYNQNKVSDFSLMMVKLTENNYKVIRYYTNSKICSL